MITKKGSIAAAMLVIALSLAGCSSSTPTTPDGGGNAPPPNNPPPVADLSLSQAWDSNGCLVDLALQDGVFVTGRESDLCRIADTTNVGLYYLYERGQSGDNWLQAYGQETDGYTYWTYPNTTWFRQPTAGGAVELKVTYPNGDTAYVDYQNWKNDGSTESLLKALTFEGIERLNLSMINIHATHTYRYAPNPATGQADQTAQGKLDAQNTQAAQQSTEFQQAQQSSGSYSRSQVDQMYQESMTRMARIWAQPACNSSYNGCR